MRAAVTWGTHHGAVVAVPVGDTAVLPHLPQQRNRLDVHTSHHTAYFSDYTAQVDNTAPHSLDCQRWIAYHETRPQAGLASPVDVSEPYLDPLLLFAAGEDGGVVGKRAGADAHLIITKAHGTIGSEAFGGTRV